jgi:hypothetical protein
MGTFEAMRTFLETTLTRDAVRPFQNSTELSPFQAMERSNSERIVLSGSVKGQILAVFV